KPPPCFSDAIKAADARGVPIEAIDMDEVTYTDNYVDCVSAFEVMFQGRLEKRLTKKRFRAANPRDFVLEWDAEVNGSPGFRRLQARREAFMAGRLRELAASRPSILALIEVERAQGVRAALEEGAEGAAERLAVPLQPPDGGGRHRPRRRPPVDHHP